MFVVIAALKILDFFGVSQQNLPWNKEKRPLLQIVISLEGIQMYRVSKASFLYAWVNAIVIIIEPPLLCRGALDLFDPGPAGVLFMSVGQIRDRALKGDSGIECLAAQASY